MAIGLARTRPEDDPEARQEPAAGEEVPLSRQQQQHPVSDDAPPSYLSVMLEDRTISK